MSQGKPIPESGKKYNLPVTGIAQASALSRKIELKRHHCIVVFRIYWMNYANVPLSSHFANL